MLLVKKNEIPLSILTLNFFQTFSSLFLSLPFSPFVPHFHKYFFPTNIYYPNFVNGTIWEVKM